MRRHLLRLVADETLDDALAEVNNVLGGGYGVGPGTWSGAV